MRINLGNTFQRILRVLHLSPLSLDQKCRLMFGSAVLLSLVIALSIPYAWLRQLTRKVLLDTHAARVESVLLRSHFRLAASGGMKLPELNERGTARDPNEPGIVWISFYKESDKAGRPPVDRLADETAGDRQDQQHPR